jgi:apolipoprotein D and lipocalin family protein
VKTPDGLRRRTVVRQRLPVAALALLFLAAGCTGLPEGVEPVQGFELDRYLGTWYEIARLDHRFERGLERVSAEYSLREDGSLRVVNRGYSTAEERWQEAEGTAYFVRGEDEGYLKVSFFGPFYGAYVVFGLDRDRYRYAFISGNSREYLWLLARTPVVEREVLERFVARAAALGFDTGKLIYVIQEQIPPAAAGR